MLIHSLETKVIDVTRMKEETDKTLQFEIERLKTQVIQLSQDLLRKDQLYNDAISKTQSLSNEAANLKSTNQNQQALIRSKDKQLELMTNEKEQT